MRVATKRQGVTASVRPVPTDNTMAVLPLTAERVGKDPADIEAEPAKIGSVKQAFETFKPELVFKHTVDDHEFVADLAFNSLNDFSPEAMRKRQAGRRNDIADMQSRVDTLNQLKVKFAQAKVKRAWDQPDHRAQLIEALKQFEQQIAKIAGGSE